uniref:T-cell surface glycoprotein CD8 beta chain-like n=1 Tax=Neolamprologus brichardi TaxID=32507 RepID=A0A3Q4MQD7_NEOBR
MKTFFSSNDCYISVSLTQFYTVAVEPGQEITLQCSNFSSFATHIFWFRLADRLNASRISFMLTANSRVTFCDGFQDTKFNMTSNTSVLFLKIKQVDPSDSGLYFCGELHMGRPSVFTATYLKVQGKIAEYPICATFFVVDVLLEDGLTNLSTLILGSLTVFLLLVIIGLVVSIRKLHTGIYVKQKMLPYLHLSHLDSDAMNYAALSFHTRTNMRRPPPQRELEPNVLYAATR